MLEIYKGQIARCYNNCLLDIENLPIIYDAIDYEGLGHPIQNDQATD